MRNRRTKKILQEYPQLLDDSIVLSPIEVERIIGLANHVLSFEELIERTKIRFPQFAQQNWKEIDIAIQRHKKFDKGCKQIRITYRIAIASIAIMIILFFSFIPAGRTMAQAVYNYIVNVFGSSMTVVPEGPQNGLSGTLPQSTASPRITYTTVEDFSMQTGYIPIQLNAGWLVLDEIFGEYIPEFGQFVFMTYSDTYGKKIIISQKWLKGIQFDVVTDGDDFDTIRLSDECILYSSTSPINGSWDGTIVWGDSIIQLNAEEGIDHKRLIASLSDTIK